MPLESGRPAVLSGEPSHLQEDASRNPVQPDSADILQAHTGGQFRNPEPVLGNSGEDINLGQYEQPQEQFYNSEAQRNVYQNQEKSFNEQRQDYTEKSFNSYNYEIFIEQTISRAEEFKRAGGIGSTRTAGNGDKPVMLPSADPDSELELSGWTQKMMDRNGKNIGRLEKSSEKNVRQREKLKKKQPAVKKFSIREGRTVEKRLNEREYGKQRRDETRRSQRRERKNAEVKKTGRLLFNDGTIEEDEDAAEVKRAVHKSAYSAKRRIKRNVDDIRDRRYVYQRLKFRDKKDSLISKEGNRLKHEQGRILAVNKQMAELDKTAGRTAKGGADSASARKEAARRAENRKIQQQKRQRKRIEQYQKWIRTEGGIQRIWNQHRMNKTTRKELKAALKRNLTVISSIASLVCTMLIVTMLIVLFLMSFFQLFADVMTKTVTQNDYTVLTDVTGYLRNLEADLKDLVAGEGREDLEKNLDEECLAQTGEHIYEFIYNLPEFGFDDISLMAYLSAKFFEFDLEQVQADLEEIFELMYQINIRFEKEERTFYDKDGNPYIQEVMICYITVSKTELEEVVESRLDEEALELYKTYKLSCGGQQTYGPVLDGTDWSGKISSSFGERIHPITGKKTFHDGVDIAIPVGTKLYSAVTGTVTSAYYSSSGGNMVTVRTESGWEVTFMHMDSISVSAGQTVFKGQFVGCSGNTGNSTGPHLHIRVHDADGRKINPVFIIPQSGNIYNKEV